MHPYRTHSDNARAMHWPSGGTLAGVVFEVTSTPHMGKSDEMIVIVFAVKTFFCFPHSPCHLDICWARHTHRFNPRHNPYQMHVKFCSSKLYVLFFIGEKLPKNFPQSLSH
jgi:hypothetical protein